MKISRRVDYVGVKKFRPALCCIYPPSPVVHRRGRVTSLLILKHHHARTQSSFLQQPSMLQQLPPFVQSQAPCHNVTPCAYHTLASLVPTLLCPGAALNIHSSTLASTIAPPKSAPISDTISSPFHSPLLGLRSTGSSFPKEISAALTKGSFIPPGPKSGLMRAPPAWVITSHFGSDKGLESDPF